VTGRVWNRAWLVVALIVVGLAMAREARSFGFLGVVGPVVAFVLVLVIVRAVAPGWMVSSRRRSGPTPAPRDVTPREPAISAGSSIAPRPSPAPVVILDAAPDQAIATLEAKLATLDRLHDDGRLTDAEYEAKRAQLIADY
jgi:hypothetical protein